MPEPNVFRARVELWPCDCDSVLIVAHHSIAPFHSPWLCSVPPNSIRHGSRDPRVGLSGARPRGPVPLLVPKFQVRSLARLIAKPDSYMFHAAVHAALHAVDAAAAPPRATSPNSNLVTA